MKVVSFLGASCVGLICACSAQEAPDLSKMKIDEIYQNLCANCHGDEFQGGMGGSLVDGVWKHGSTDQGIAASIRDGNAAAGMEAFGDTLTDQQIRSMVIYFREQEKKFANKDVKFPTPEPGAITETQHEDYTVEVVTEGLETPWAVAFLPSGQRLVTEKAGPLRLIEADGTLHPDPIKDTPRTAIIGQGGMMEVALHPDYEENGWIYLGFVDVHPDDVDKEKGKRGNTAYVRGRIKDHTWVDEEEIYRSDIEDYISRGSHWGTRIVFDKGYVYFPVGERGGNKAVQQVNNSKGKTFRLHDDGRVPEDNPEFDGDDPVAGMWTMGHRNPQGFAKDPRNGDIYSTEHGPRGGDELNLIEPGKNYGWPVVTYGMNYNGTPITDVTEREGIQNPVTYWTPSIAVCGLDFYVGEKFPNWQNDLLVGALRQEEIRRLRIVDREVTEEEVILKDIGRIRDVATGRDGYIYALTNKPDRLIRLKPASEVK